MRHRNRVLAAFLLLAVVLNAPALAAGSESPADVRFAEIVHRARQAKQLVITHVAGTYESKSDKLEARWPQVILDALDLEHRSPSTHGCWRSACADSIPSPGHMDFSFGSGKSAVRLRWTFWTGALEVVDSPTPMCVAIRDQHFQLLHYARQALPRDDDLRDVRLCRSVDPDTSEVDTTVAISAQTTFEQGDPRIQSAPEAITKVPPSYPDRARETGVDGTVWIRARVGSDGRATEARVSGKSIPMLDEAAKAAVMQWRFRPGRVAGQNVSTWTLVPIRFSLH